MEKIPTAEEFMLENLESMDQTEVETAMIEFAQLHVKAALKEASEKKTDGMLVVPLFNEYQRDTILNSYSLENIK